MNNRSITSRLTALETRLPTIPTFSEFSAEWKNMDELSKSLILLDVSAKEHAGDKYTMTVGGYLKMMGIETELPFSLEELAGGLESDP